MDFQKFVPALVTKQSGHRHTELEMSGIWKGVEYFSSTLDVLSNFSSEIAATT